MRHTVLIILLIFSKNTFSQSNFTASENNLTWQKIFDLDSINNTIIIKHLNQKPSISNIYEITNQISADVTNDQVDYKNYGGKTMNTLIVLNHKLHAKLIIDIKENKYRVTIKNINFTDDWSIASANPFNNSDSKLEDYALKSNGDIRKNNTILKGLEYLDKHFTEQFTITTTKDDW